MSSKQYNRVSAISVEVVTSGERLRGEGLAWLVGAVVCLLAATAGPKCPLARVADGHICAAAPLVLALANQLALPEIARLSKRAVHGLPCK